MPGLTQLILFPAAPHEDNTEGDNDNANRPDADSSADGVNFDIEHAVVVVVSINVIVGAKVEAMLLCLVCSLLLVLVSYNLPDALLGITGVDGVQGTAKGDKEDAELDAHFELVELEDAAKRGDRLKGGTTGVAGTADGESNSPTFSFCCP